MNATKNPTIWTGNTFPIKETIKSLGGKWDDQKKAWLVPALSMAQRSKLSTIFQQLKSVTIQPQ